MIISVYSVFISLNVTVYNFNEFYMKFINATFLFFEQKKVSEICLKHFCKSTFLENFWWEFF